MNEQINEEGDESMWLALEALRRFSEETPKVVISTKEVSIAAEARDDFYQVFDEAAAAVAQQFVADEMEEASDLVSRYRFAESVLKESTGIDQVVLPSKLMRFVDDPLSALAGGIQNIVFDYLQDGGDFERLMQRARAQVNADYRCLYRCVYEYWIFFTLINGLLPQKIYHVFYDGISDPFITSTLTLEPGKQLHIAGKRAPDTVVVTQDGTCYALKFECSSEIAYYDVPMFRRRDNTFGGDSRGILGQRTLLLFALESLEKVPVIADRDKKTLEQPLLSVEIGSEVEFSIPASRLALGNRALTLRPLLGHHVVNLSQSGGIVWADSELEMIAEEPDVRVIVAGKDLEVLASCVVEHERRALCVS